MLIDYLRLILMKENYIKKLISLSLSLLALFSFSLSSYAAENSISTSTNSKEEQLNWVEFSDINDISFEDTYSYDELVNHFKDCGFSDEEILHYIGEQPSIRSSTVRYSLVKMTPYTYYLNLSNFSLQPRFTIGLEYISGNSSPDSIVSIEGGHIFTSDPDTTDQNYFSNCSFSGTVLYKLVSGNEIYYNFYGDLYRAGSVQWSVGAKVSIGQTASVNASISNGNGYLSNLSEADSVIFAGLNP